VLRCRVGAEEAVLHVCLHIPQAHHLVSEEWLVLGSTVRSLPSMRLASHPIAASPFWRAVLCCDAFCCPAVACFTRLPLPCWLALLFTDNYLPLLPLSVFLCGSAWQSCGTNCRVWVTRTLWQWSWRWVGM
jgi:hypothetical protein